MTSAVPHAVQSCPNCPGVAAARVFAFGRDNAVVRCTSCGLEYAHRYLEPDVAAATVYRDEYFAVAIEEEARRRNIFQQLLAEVEGVLGRRGRLLDVGAGEGLLVEVAQEHGWRAEGTEIAAAMVERSRHAGRVRLHHGELESLALPAGAYDAIVMNHVLEHLRNPRAALEVAARLLAPGGIVRIEVPNLAGLSSRWKNWQSRARLKRSPWKHYSVGHHFWFFTPATLQRTVEAAGLEVLRMQAPAQQWDRTTGAARLWNDASRRRLWGGHLVTYARRHRD